MGIFYGLFYQKHYDPVKDYILRRVYNETVAEDLAQEAFLFALEHWDRYEGENSQTADRGTARGD